MKEREGEHPYGDVGQLVVFGVFVAVWVGDSFILRKSTFLAESIPLYVRLAVAGLSVLGSLFLIRDAHALVDEHNESPRIIDTGSFRYVRHPMYLASILAFFGLAVSTLSIVVLVVFAIAIVFYDRIAAYEERDLIGRFGEAYRDYMSRTGKWIPKIGREVTTER